MKPVLLSNRLADSVSGTVELKERIKMLEIRGFECDASATRGLVSEGGLGG